MQRFPRLYDAQRQGCVRGLSTTALCVCFEQTCSAVVLLSKDVLGFFGGGGEVVAAVHIFL